MKDEEEEYSEDDKAEDPGKASPSQEDDEEEGSCSVSISYDEEPQQQNSKNGQASKPKEEEWFWMKFSRKWFLGIDQLKWNVIIFRHFWGEAHHLGHTSEEGIGKAAIVAVVLQGNPQTTNPIPRYCS